VPAGPPGRPNEAEGIQYSDPGGGLLPPWQLTDALPANAASSAARNVPDSRVTTCVGNEKSSQRSSAAPPRRWAQWWLMS
jgi:hypothetical protein